MTVLGIHGAPTVVPRRQLSTEPRSIAHRPGRYLQVDMSERGLEGDPAGSFRTGESNDGQPQDGPARTEHGPGSEAILSAVGFAASTFLQARSWEDRIAEVLERLGRAAGVSRVYVFQNHTDAEGRRLHSQRFEWAAEGIQSQMDNPDLQGSPWE